MNHERTVDAAVTLVIWALAPGGAERLMVSWQSSPGRGRLGDSVSEYRRVGTFDEEVETAVVDLSVGVLECLFEH